MQRFAFLLTAFVALILPSMVAAHVDPSGLAHWHAPSDGMAIGEGAVRTEQAQPAPGLAAQLSFAPVATAHFSDAGDWVSSGYLLLGMRHILSGVDHLLFVLGLMLLVGTGWRLVGAISAFTLAHSLTLGASALGFVAIPTDAVEALIALSIVFVAWEVLRKDAGVEGLAARLPWAAALAFGLLHGFGFAGALAETGLPHDQAQMALLAFNAGVEIGQLSFVAAMLALAGGWRMVSAGKLSRGDGLTVRRLTPWAIGCYAAFLFVERTAAAIV